ncbi:hypothetical protein T484DRAFT_2016531 [Baffinella frigidus]|nr:hypothetical protein T484DRAFT_2016531 [Cryptophyta sp. CCMP2293]
MAGQRALLVALATLLASTVTDAFSLAPAAPALRSARSSYVAPASRPTLHHASVGAPRHGRAMPALRMAWELPPFVAAKVGKSESVADELHKITVNVPAEIAASFKVSARERPRRTSQQPRPPKLTIQGRFRNGGARNRGFETSSPPTEGSRKRPPTEGGSARIKSIWCTSESVADELHKITVDVPAEIAASFKIGGQYVMIKENEAQEKPGFFAVASAPGASPSSFEFLIKKTDGSAWFCDAAAGKDVICTAAQGKGYKIADQAGYTAVVALATGSGIAPVKALLESGAAKADKVKLYYGCRTLSSMAFQDLFPAWEKAGIEVIPVLSKPDASWKGKTGYVQDVMKADGIADPAATVVVMCGGNDFQKQAKEVIKEAGIPDERVLTNF